LDIATNLFCKRLFAENLLQDAIKKYFIPLKEFHKVWEEFYSFAANPEKP